MTTAEFGGTTGEFQGHLVRAYHEVRSPTALIATVARSALEAADVGEARAALELIERIAGRALRRVATVLDSTGVASAHPSDRLGEIIADLRRCGLDVELRVDPRVAAAEIAHEESAFEALAQTLLDNAEAHGDPTCAVQVRLRRTRGGIRFTVANRPAHVARHSGHGVGLPLAVELTRRMGGTLNVRRGADKFVVQARLPAAAIGHGQASEEVFLTRR